MKKEDVLVSLGILGVGAGVVWAIATQTKSTPTPPQIPVDSNPPQTPKPPQPSQPPQPSSNVFSLESIKPINGQYFSWIFSSQIQIQAIASNETSSDKKVFLGASIKNPDQTVKDFPIVQVYLPANSTQIVSPATLQAINYLGNYQIRMSLWDVFPSGNCESAGTCKRLADTGWISFIVGP